MSLTDSICRKTKSDGRWVSGCFFALEPSVFKYLSGDQDVWEQEPLRRLAEEHQLFAYRHHDFWAVMDFRLTAIGDPVVGTRGRAIARVLPILVRTSAVRYRVLPCSSGTGTMRITNPIRTVSRTGVGDTCWSIRCALNLSAYRRTLVAKLTICSSQLTLRRGVEV